MVERQRQLHDRTRHHLAVDHPRAVEDPPHREDRGLPGAEDRGAAVDAEHADVRQRDRAPGEVRRRRPPGARRLDQRLHRTGELEQAQARGALDGRDQQPARGVGRDAEVDVAVDHDVRPVGRVDPRGVDHRVAPRPPGRVRPPRGSSA